MSGEKIEFPTREQIDQIVDVDALQRLRDDVFAAKNSIETQLEFSDRDEEWARRAMAALTVHKTVLGQLDKRIHRLRKGSPVTPPQDPERKVRKAEAHAARLKAEAEEKGAKLALQRERTRTEVARAVTASSLSMSIQEAMKAELDLDTYSRVMNAASAIHSKRLHMLLEGET